MWTMGSTLVGRQLGCKQGLLKKNMLQQAFSACQGRWAWQQANVLPWDWQDRGPVAQVQGWFLGCTYQKLFTPEMHMLQTCTEHYTRWYSQNGHTTWCASNLGVFWRWQASWLNFVAEEVFVFLYVAKMRILESAHGGQGDCCLELLGCASEYKVLSEGATPCILPSAGQRYIPWRWQILWVGEGFGGLVAAGWWISVHPFCYINLHGDTISWGWWWLPSAFAEVSSARDNPQEKWAQNLQKFNEPRAFEPKEEQQSKITAFVEQGHVGLWCVCVWAVAFKTMTIIPLWAINLDMFF